MDEEATMPETAAPEEIPVRHPLHQRLKGYNPDKEYPDDTSLLDDADAKLGELDEYRQNNETANQQIIEAIDSEPVLGAVIADVIKGMTFRAAVARHFDPEDLAAEEGDPDFESIETNKQERLTKKAERESYLAELQQNIQESQTAIQAFAEDQGMDEEASVSFLGNVTQILTDAYKGKITTDFLARMYTAENHEKEVAAAAENGVIEGRNMAIDEKKAVEASNKTGDGLPVVGTGAASIPPAVEKKPTTAGSFLSGTGIMPKK